AIDLDEIAEEPAGQVDQVDALVQEFAAAGQGRVGAPFPVVAQAATVAVAGPDVHERPQLPGGAQGLGLDQGGVEAVVEAHLDVYAGGPRRGQHGPQLGGAAGRGFFHE